MARTRQNQLSWIEAGLKGLPKDGPDALRAETLARKIGTTKGSFYWHFKDVPAFQAALLTHWSREFLNRFSAAMDDPNPVARLRALGGFTLSQVDHAVRAWGVSDKAARKVIKMTDAKMRTQIAATLKELDAPHPDFPGIVLSTVLNARKDSSEAETLVDLLLMLK